MEFYFGVLDVVLWGRYGVMTVWTSLADLSQLRYSVRVLDINRLILILSAADHAASKSSS